MLQPVAVGHKGLADYTHIVGRSLVEEIKALSDELKGKRVLHLSATAFGGGVSEILYTLVPLMRDVGIEAVVDEHSFDAGAIRLVKSLPPADQ